MSGYCTRSSNGRDCKRILASIRLCSTPKDFSRDDDTDNFYDELQQAEAR